MFMNMWKHLWEPIVFFPFAGLTSWNEITGMSKSVSWTSFAFFTVYFILEYFDRDKILFLFLILYIFLNILYVAVVYISLSREKHLTFSEQYFNLFIILSYPLLDNIFINVY